MGSYQKSQRSRSDRDSTCRTRKSAASALALTLTTPRAMSLFAAFQGLAHSHPRRTSPDKVYSAQYFLVSLRNWRSGGAIVSIPGCTLDNTTEQGNLLALCVA